MNKVLMIMLVVALYSCSSLRNDKGFRDEYIQEFKMVYFTKCLKYGFNNKEINTLNNIDGSRMSEPILGTRTYPFLDSLALQRTKDRIRPVGTRAEGVTGNPVYYDCLCDYNSKWLKTLAIKKYKELER